MKEKHELNNGSAEIISELNKFSGFRIKNIDDVTLLIEFRQTNYRLFEEIIFIAKYVNGLEKVLQRFHHTFNIQNKEESLKKVTDEYKKNILIFLELLRKFIDEISITTDFGRKYLSHTQTSMSNLMSLISDLSWLKKFYNSRRT